MATADDELLIVLEDNSIFRYSATDATPSRELDLPARERPLQLVTAGRRVYALVPASLARRLDGPDATATAPSSRPFDPGESSLSVAAYDGNRWSVLAACPAVAEWNSGGAAQPRLSVTQGICCCWATPPQIHYARLDVSKGEWRATGTIGSPGMTGFWVSSVGGVPTLVTAGEATTAYRLLPDGDEFAWRRGDLRLPDAAGATVVSAFGFNQHVGLLLRLSDGEPALQFGRFGDPPSDRCCGCARR